MPQQKVTCGHRDVETIAPSEWVTSAAPAILETAVHLHSQRPPQPRAGRRADAMLDAALLKHIKIADTLVQNHPWAVHAAGAVPQVLELATAVLTREDCSGVAWPRVVSRATALALHVFTSTAYQFKKQAVTLRTPVRVLYKLQYLGVLKCPSCSGSSGCIPQQLCRQQHMHFCSCANRTAPG